MLRSGQGGRRSPGACLSGRHQIGIWSEKKKKMSKKMIGDSPVEYSFKNKGPMKIVALPLAPVLLVQNSADAREAGVEEITIVVGTSKKSLNRSWRCSGKIFRGSSQYSASTEMEHSNGILTEFRDNALSLRAFFKLEKA